MERDSRPSVASALAIEILREQIKKTGRLGIPSLGIKLTKDDLLKTEPSEPHQEKPKKLGNQG